MKASTELERAWRGVELRRYSMGSEALFHTHASDQARGYYEHALDEVSALAPGNLTVGWQGLQAARFRLALSMAMSDEAGR